MVLVADGCAEPSSTSTQANPPTTAVPAQPRTLKVEFPNGAPALDQTAELTCTMVVSTWDDFTIDLNVKLPDAFELVSGSLSWSGDISGGGTFTLVSAQVKATKVGYFNIYAKAYIARDYYPTDDGYMYSRTVDVIVTEDSAVWGYGLPRSNSEPGVVPIRQVPGKWSVIETDLQVSCAPKLWEPAELSITILSPVDFPGMTAEIIFHHGVELLEGAEKQTIDLKAGVPVHLSATIIFTETGSHTVTADVAELIDGVWHHSPQNTISFDIGIEQSTYQHGLPESTQKPTDDLPPPPSIPSIP
jgi:hypothetical protein